MIVDEIRRTENEMTFPILKNPPLKEAILEVLLEYNTENLLAMLNEFSDSVKSDLPLKFEIIKVETELTGTGQINSAMKQPKVAGLRLCSEDQKFIVILLENGITISAVEMSYRNWSEFYPKAYDYVSRFVKIINPKRINRCSLRFINEIRIERIEDFAELKLNLTIPTDWLKGSITGINIQLGILSEDPSLRAVVRQLFESRNNELILFYDIDALSNSAEVTDIDSVFSNLRIFKNKLFFEAIGEKLLQKFNQ